MTMEQCKVCHQVVIDGLMDDGRCKPCGMMELLRSTRRTVEDFRELMAQVDAIFPEAEDERKPPSKPGPARMWGERGEG